MITYPPASLVKVITLATLLIGTLDISEVFLFYGLRGVLPILIPQSIASGILGRSSFGMGLRSALLGMALHYFISFVVVGPLFAGQPQTSAPPPSVLLRRSLRHRSLLFMNDIVIPLSRQHRPQHFFLAPFLNGLAASIFVIGIPTAVIARRFLVPELAKQ